MEVVILSRIELLVLWAIALAVPAAAHLGSHWIGKRLGVPPVRPLPRIALLTCISVATLIWLTGSRFAAVAVEGNEARVRYAPPIARTVSIPLDDVERVILQESGFPRTSFSLAIRSRRGDTFRSVAVTPFRLSPIYTIYEALRPGETPFVPLAD
ncbi:MAG: hypothetical protein JW958_12400 [Candidatus Eisenbacteria bacterium]|nr:hypothetical protein [Candidatus Eisenbacteria bacterium]